MERRLGHAKLEADLGHGCAALRLPQRESDLPICLAFLFHGTARPSQEFIVPEKLALPADQFQGQDQQALLVNEGIQGAG